MSYSIGLSNFKKVAAVATVFTIATCLVPDSTQAVRLEFSGSPNTGETYLDFNLDTSILDSANAPNIGSFLGAIQNASYRCSENSISFCGGQRQIFFNPGNLQASPIVSLADLNNYPAADRFIGGVKYEARLDSPSSSDFIEFGILVGPSGFDLINSLSELSSVFINNRSDVYVGVRDLNSQDGFFIGAGSRFEVITSVPEPDGTSSVLVAGAIGVLLLKPIRRSKKLTQSKVTLSK
ncbi:hypothetical protein [Microseira sp. BLCC-F43]|jgi:hypothetical protein|uniref:hypothetical protein n=1 Tax=Microseira sp. BLCC-F43 TaxID=3153602 RepID=UPI0035B959BD